MKKIILITALLFSGLAKAEFSVFHNLNGFVICTTKQKAIDMTNYIDTDMDKFKSVLKNDKSGCAYMDNFKSKYEVFVADLFETEDKVDRVCKLAIYEENNGKTQRTEYYSFKTRLNDPCGYYEFHAFNRYYDPTQDK